MSTAASRNASAQVRSGKIALPIKARSPSVIGIASTIARVTGPQWTRRSSLSTNSPSENRVRINANSIRSTIAGSRASTETTLVLARTIPSATESTEMESTVPRITPDSAAATANSPPTMSKASPNPIFSARRVGDTSPRIGRSHGSGGFVAPLHRGPGRAARPGWPRSRPDGQLTSCPAGGPPAAGAGR